MKSIRTVILTLFFILLPLVLEAQGAFLRRGDTQYNRGEYYKALQFYNQATEGGFKLSRDYQLKVAHCYYELNNVDEAWSILNEHEDALRGYDLFLYASATHGIGFYEGAIDLYQRAKPENPDRIGFIDELIRSCEWAMKHDEFLPVRVNPSKIMTFGQSFGLQFYKDGIVYSSASPEGEAKRTDRQGRNFLSLYYSDLEGDEITNTRLFSKNLVFDFHVGAISFSPDEKTMYYTKTVRVRGGDNKLKIFSVIFDGEDWVDEVDLNINSNDFDNAHPAVTPDGNHLIFVSNRPGGYGGKDLWIADIRPNRTLSNVRNLGPKINSFADEIFPFVSQDNTLYFSSDGHIGFGGLDLFKSEYKNNSWSTATNLGQPYNSYKDDFGYVIDPNDNTKGFLSTNRIGDGSDVIFYVYTAPEPEAIEEEEVVPIAGLLDEDILLPPEMQIIEELKEEEPEEIIVVEEPKIDLSLFPSSFKSYVVSTFNGNLLENTAITFSDKITGATIFTVRTDNKGSFNIPIPDEYRKEGQEFNISAIKDGFKEVKADINILDIDTYARNGIQLSPIFEESELNEIDGLKIPYVGLNILDQGYSTLDQVAAYLLNNPQVVIKLNGHSDVRGTMMANLNNSQKIAETAKDYLLSKGVSNDNLIARGYGERYLTNRCKRGVVCTESQHLENRRVEIVVWKIKQ